MHQFEMIRGGNVTVTASTDSKGHPVATIVVNDKYEHVFDASSRVSKQLEMYEPSHLEEQLSGGNFFFVERELYDMRYGNYNGFIHSDESIAKLAEIVGIEARHDSSVRVYENVIGKSHVLGSMWSDHGIVVPHYNDGGEFKSQLHFGWSPFMKTVNSAFMLYRLVCENGMRGLRAFMNTKIPLFNRWEENLDIANIQIQNKVESMVMDRIGMMGKERASVQEVALLAQHAHNRMIEQDDPMDLDRLSNIYRIASPIGQLGHVYREGVFLDSNLAAQHPAHLTVLDVFNMSTEMRTHTNETDKSSGLALDKFANTLMFDRKDLTGFAGTYSSPKLCSFSNPDEAFFGLIH